MPQQNRASARTAAAIAAPFTTAAIGNALARLGAAPRMLLFFVLAVNAVSTPYQGRVHDATLYSFQALNHLSAGRFSDDLFFKYGSQDRFSAFSTLVSPLAGLLGLEATFFVLYLVSVVLFYWAAIRLTRQIVDSDAAVAVSVILIAVTPVWFGGLHVFRANEAFFTPRLPACALGLIALERLLAGRVPVPVLCLVAATALHPLMAGGAVLLALAYAFWTFLGRRSVSEWALLLTLGVALVIGLIVVTGHYVPVLDDDWRAVIRAASPYNFPADWTSDDWLVVGGSVAIIAAAAYLTRGRPALSRLLGVSVVVALAGLGLTWYASGSTHSLLFQIQPYRVLWVLAVLQIPCGLILIRAAWESRNAWWSVLTLLVAAYLLRTDLPFTQVQLTLVMLPIAFLVVRTAAPARNLADTLWRSTAFAIAAGILGIIVLGCTYLVLGRAHLMTEFDPVTYARLWLKVIGPAGWLLVACGTVVGLVRRLGRKRQTSTALVGVFLLVHSAIVTIPSLRSYRDRFVPEALRSLAFVEGQLEPLKHRQRPVTMYMDWGAPGDAWLQFEVSSYFELTQVVGVIFSRQTAMEAAQRARRVALFEARRHAQDREFGSDNLHLMTDRLFGVSRPHPSLQDLQLLCADEAVDIAALKESIGPAESISNGTIYIYDCRQFRIR